MSDDQLPKPAPPGSEGGPAPGRLEPSDATPLEAATAVLPMHAYDRVPDWILRSHAWLNGLMSSESRLVLGLFIVGLAVAFTLILSSFQLLATVLVALDVVSFVGLFLVNWLGNGGALVPIPGARMLGLLMIFQHAVLSTPRGRSSS